MQEEERDDAPPVPMRIRPEQNMSRKDADAMRRLVKKLQQSRLKYGRKA